MAGAQEKVEAPMLCEVRQQVRGLGNRLSIVTKGVGREECGGNQATRQSSRQPLGWKKPGPVLALLFSAVCPWAGRLPLSAKGD